MRFSVSGEQRSHFFHHKQILFESPLSQAAVEQLEIEIVTTLSERLTTTDLHKLPFDTLFRAGRDLHIENPQIKRILCNRALGGLLSDLVRKSPLRLALSQVIFTPNKNVESHFPLFTDPFPLSQWVSIQSPLLGVLIDLQGDPLSPFELTDKNKVLLFHYTFEFPMPLLLQPSKRYILAVFAEETVIYKSNILDPCGQLLRNRGYNFGDRLKDDTHPLVALMN